MVVMLSSSSGEERPSSLMEANTVAVSVGAGRGDYQQLKDLLTKEDSMTSMGIQASTVKPLQAVTMNPLLLSSACSGSWQDLEILLNRGSGQLHPSVRFDHEFSSLLTPYGSSNCSNNKGTLTQKASDDVEASLNLPLISAVSLLAGVTTEGGTALHMVATYGDCDGFLRSADIIYGKAKHHLFAQDKNGDTPLISLAWPGTAMQVLTE